jgi:hypothetical protein
MHDQRVKTGLQLPRGQFANILGRQDELDPAPTKALTVQSLAASYHKVVAAAKLNAHRRHCMKILQAKRKIMKAENSIQGYKEQQ